MGYKIDDFSLDLRKSTAPPDHIWVNSGYSTCSLILNTVMGAVGCFSPPIAAKDTMLMFEIAANGHIIEDTGNTGKDDCGFLFAGALWRPDKIIRKGTYHYNVDNNLISLHVVSELVPLTGKAGFMMRIIVRNRAEKPADIGIMPLVNPGHPSVIPLGEWGFGQPSSSEHNAAEIIKNVWENNDIRVTLLSDKESNIILKKDEVFECNFAIVFTGRGTAAEKPSCLNKWYDETRETWEKRIALANERIPVIRSSIPGLEEYYRRSLISGLVCLWENEGYIVNPFPATSGMDGGAICCYPWDVAGYSAQTLVMLLGEKVLDFIRLMLKSGIDKHISMSLDGGGLGWCSYSYSMWSIVYFYWVVVTQTGKGFDLLEDIVGLFQTEEERLEEWENLKDYGRQHNLLEMRTCGYEYFVVSPNAERAWCYDCLADIAEYAGRKEFGAWHEKAENIRESIRKNLWDEDRGWFKCIHPDGHIETVYSIQIYDALRMGVCTEAMKKALVAHIQEGAFLGEFGVSSISSEDEIHYELNDPDWSGGGAYSGDGPNLAETLWQNKEPRLAWDVLKRHFWIGKMLPYIPQEHYCDRPAVPAHKRANVISGTAGLQAILFGMSGIKPQLDGSLHIAPQPAEEGEIEIYGMKYRSLNVDILMRPEYVKIWVNNEVVYEGKPREVSL